MNPRTAGLVAVAALASACASAAPEAPVAAAPFPTVAPVPGPAPSLNLPEPVRETLDNGLQVLYVPHGTLPVVHATLTTRGGTADDPAELPGLAPFVAEMLDEGAGGRDALQLSAALDQLGATLRTGAGWDAAFVDLHVLRDRLPAALALMADVAVRPDFAAREVARVREERVTDLTRARDEARVIAGNAFNALVYGADHPYGRLPSVATTQRVDADALRRFHATHYRPGSSTLILVGDVDPAVLRPVVQRAFGGWSGGSAPAASPPSTPTARPTALFLVDKPGAAQSEIRVGHPGVARGSPDYFPLVVLNTLLGGSFTSRLNSNLREQHGYAYGAGSSFSMRRGAGPFVATSSVFTAKTDSAVLEFFRELNRIRDETVDPAELERAKRYVALGIPRRFETTQDVASQLADLETYGESLDHYRTYVERILAVTPADIRRVANQYLHPDRSVVVVVGDRSQVEPGLRTLDLGPLEIRETLEFVR